MDPMISDHSLRRAELFRQARLRLYATHFRGAHRGGNAQGDNHEAVPEVVRQSKDLAGSSRRALYSASSKAALSDLALVSQLQALSPGAASAFGKYEQFQIIWRHPATRLAFVLAMLALDVYNFSEDPTTYSMTPCELAGVGEVVNLLVRFDIAPDKRPVRWMLWTVLRCVLIVFFVRMGLEISRLFERSLAICCEMFRYSGSSLAVRIVVVWMCLYSCAICYNTILKSVGYCGCSRRSCSGCLTKNLGVTNARFAYITECMALVVDLLAVFSVVDLIFQDESIYFDFGSFKFYGRRIDIGRFWRKHRTYAVWGAFCILVVAGVSFLSIYDFMSWQVTGGLASALPVHRTTTSRILVAGLLFVMDLCIVTQDLDFPHFSNSLDVKMLGTNYIFEGRFANYIMTFVSMILDLNCLVMHGAYTPAWYGQYLDKNGHICVITNFTGSNVISSCNSCGPLVRAANATHRYEHCRVPCGLNVMGCCGDICLSSRYDDQIGSLPLLIITPVALGIGLWCLLYMMSRTSPVNLCRRVVISNLFAHSLTPETCEVELGELTSSAVAASRPALPALRRATLAQAESLPLHASLQPVGTESACESEVRGPRVVVVTAYGVQVFELRDGFTTAQEASRRDPQSCQEHMRRSSGEPFIAANVEERQASDRQCGNQADFVTVLHLKHHLVAMGLVRSDVSCTALKLLWRGRFVEDDVFLGSLGDNVTLYLLYSKQSLRTNRLRAAVMRAS